MTDADRLALVARLNNGLREGAKAYAVIAQGQEMARRITGLCLALADLYDGALTGDMYELDEKFKEAYLRVMMENTFLK